MNKGNVTKAFTGKADGIAKFILSEVGIGFILILVMMLNKPEDKIEILYSYTGPVPEPKPVKIPMPSTMPPMLEDSRKVRAFDSATGKEIDIDVI